jgi:cyclopropane-fatty-acyl-phospholipid synthase
VSGLVSAINSGSKGTLIVDRIDNIGGHYAITLRHWREQFIANFDTEILPALRRRAKGEGKQMNEDDALIFKRKWEVFLLNFTVDSSTTTLIVKQAFQPRHWGM